MSTPLRLAAALLVPLLLLGGCGDDEPDNSEPSSEQPSEPTDDASTDSTDSTDTHGGHRGHGGHRVRVRFVGGDRRRL